MTEPKKCCEDFHARGGSVIECSCLPNSPYHTPDAPTDTGWEEKFARFDFDPVIHSKGRMYFNANQVKDFIRTTLSTQRTALLEELRGIRENWSGDGQFVTKGILGDLDALITSISEEKV